MYLYWFFSKKLNYLLQNLLHLAQELALSAKLLPLLLHLVEYWFLLSNNKIYNNKLYLLQADNICTAVSYREMTFTNQSFNLISFLNNHKTRVFCKHNAVDLKELNVLHFLLCNK